MGKKTNSPNRSGWIKYISDLSAAITWTRSSYYLMSAFIAVILLIIVVWYPLVEQYLALFNPNYPIWVQLDWLLLGIFAAMSLLIMAGANLKTDVWIVLVGLLGGLVIESWGTQTNLWSYFTLERPPLWIIPAWPIASLSIDRIVRIFTKLIPSELNKIYRILYWVVFIGFFGYMIYFVRFTLDKSLTWMAIIVCILLIITPTNYRLAFLTFLAGSFLGYFLELWGTTRLCWTYYTRQTPPFFAVLAHGLAAVAFWRTWLLLKSVFLQLQILTRKPQKG